MPTESWIAPDEAPEMAAHAAAVIDAALVGSGLARDAYWAAVRKGYNTPYNDPPPGDAARPATAVAAAPVAVILGGVDPGAEDPGAEPALPVAAMAALAAEARAV